MEGLTSLGFPAVFRPKMLIIECSQPSPMLRLVELIGAEGINLFTPDLSLIHYLLLNIYFVKHLAVVGAASAARTKQTF